MRIVERVNRIVGILVIGFFGFYLFEDFNPPIEILFTLVGLQFFLLGLENISIKEKHVGYLYLITGITLVMGTIVLL